MLHPSSRFFSFSYSLAHTCFTPLAYIILIIHQLYEAGDIFCESLGIIVLLYLLVIDSKTSICSPEEQIVRKVMSNDVYDFPLLRGSLNYREWSRSMVTALGAAKLLGHAEGQNQDLHPSSSSLLLPAKRKRKRGNEMRR